MDIDSDDFDNIENDIISDEDEDNFFRDYISNDIIHQ
jgi:hypothetical protein